MSKKVNHSSTWKRDVKMSKKAMLTSYQEVSIMRWKWQTLSSFNKNLEARIILHKLLETTSTTNRRTIIYRTKIRGKGTSCVRAVVWALLFVRAESFRTNVVSLSRSERLKNCLNKVDTILKVALRNTKTKTIGSQSTSPQISNLGALKRRAHLQRCQENLYQSQKLAGMNQRCSIARLRVRNSKCKCRLEVVCLGAANLTSAQPARRKRTHRRPILNAIVKMFSQAVACQKSTQAFTHMVTNLRTLLFLVQQTQSSFNAQCFSLSNS